ncbi:hypothetical protein SDC9_164320 [bioreactor metagenome]|uniref:Uncharacterized protein n=1 Tax=bioreactor metagenome TaxID=1076179 RepID=A0A645FRC5_9ZZZZ
MISMVMVRVFLTIIHCLVNTCEIKDIMRLEQASGTMDLQHLPAVLMRETMRFSLECGTIGMFLCANLTQLVNTIM